MTDKTAIVPDEITVLKVVNKSTDIGLAAKIIYAEIGTYSAHNNGYCDYRVEYLAELTQCSQPTVRFHLKSLEEAGYIEVYTSKVFNGKRYIPLKYMDEFICVHNQTGVK